MSAKKRDTDSAKSIIIYEVDPMECPFREFKDNELSPELWGLGPAAFRTAALTAAHKGTKQPADIIIWIDEQAQPLPKSARQYLHGWVRAEDLAADRWGAEVVVFDESSGHSKISLVDAQLSHVQVLRRSSFCRSVLTACYILERVDGLKVEHQWENFMFGFTPEGWRPRCHIYSPGMKPGGGQQHRPGLSKSGTVCGKRCYLVRLYYLGAWRCVWVSDQVPVDANDAPLLPFSPLLYRLPPSKSKSVLNMVTSKEVHLWPLLICKALLKLAAPDMDSDEDTVGSLDEETVCPQDEETACPEDEPMEDFDVFHALTGCMNLTYQISEPEELWKLLSTQVPVFAWDEDDVTVASTVKTKSTKKPTAKETTLRIRNSLATIVIKDTKDLPPYWLPGITPGYEMSLLVSMIRNLPLKKPLPEPEVALWKHYRWIDWAKSHGLYDDYACPRTKFVKLNGLMKMSYAPHLLDVHSTESITMGFRKEQDKSVPQPKKGKSEAARLQNAAKTATLAPTNEMKEDLREWVRFEPLLILIKKVSVSYYPSMFQCATAARNPPVRMTKSGPLHPDITAPKCAPLYLQLDGPDENYLRLSLSCLHPRILSNSGIPIVDYIEKAHLILEKFEWFEECSVPIAKAFVQTRGYDSVEVKLQPGRHIFRLWIHSRMNFHVHLLTESTLVLGTRDVIQSAAVHECPWASKFLNNLSTAFMNWIKTPKSNGSSILLEQDFIKSYQPDLEWNRETVGYDIAFLGWMFRQALHSQLRKRLPMWEFHTICAALRYYFQDPDFGLPPKPAPIKSVKDRVVVDPCDCTMPESEEMEEIEFSKELKEEKTQPEEKPPMSPELMEMLSTPPVLPVVSQICELASGELPCSKIKKERDTLIRKHEAATILQAHWRGSWARKCLNAQLIFSPDLLKCVMDNVFGNLEVLLALMNQFFRMYPGAKSAYSVASALSGYNGLYQHQGSSSVTPKCKWIPYFQGVFYCHAPVKVHFAIQSTLQHSIVMVYDNDTELQLPQGFNAHMTFDFAPNHLGYTVVGHGTLSQAPGVHSVVHWELVVLSSAEGAFHICDNDPEGCKALPMQGSYKLRFCEIFIPNRRNILGGIMVSAAKPETICFRAVVTSPEVEIVATLRSTSAKGEPEELGTCSGKGEIHWPFIRLQPLPPLTDVMESMKFSTSNVHLSATDHTGTDALSARSLPKSSIKFKGLNIGKNKDKLAIKQKILSIEQKQYSIEVTAPAGWPLTLDQWVRVGEVRNSLEPPKVEATKKPTRPSTAKEKEKGQAPLSSFYNVQPDDAFIEMECSLAVGGGAAARPDDRRTLEFAAARKEWEANDPGRNARGAQIRLEFRTEFLQVTPPSDSVHSSTEEISGGESKGEVGKRESMQQGPSPITESGILEMTIESEEEATYLSIPNQLRDKFIPLYFLPFCLKEKNEDEGVLLTNDMAEAAKKDRLARIEASLERMKELQDYNEEYVLQRQRWRCRLLETLLIDASRSPELNEALEARDEAVVQETHLRQLSSTKKKLESKKK